MNDALALVFDVGTQSVRAMLFDAAGNIIRAAQDIYEQPYYSRNPNWAEQRPDFYFEHICIVSQRLKDQSPEDFARAASVAVTEAHKFNFFSFHFFHERSNVFYSADFIKHFKNSLSSPPYLMCR